MTKVLVTGTFDILHPGHLNFFKQAKELADSLIVLIARDENVIKAKGHSPYFNEHQRLENLQKLNLADQAVLGDLRDPYKVIAEIRPDIIALGYDQQFYVNGLFELRLKSGTHFKIERLEPFKEEICKARHFRKIMEEARAGFLLIDKPGSSYPAESAGSEDWRWTSFDVVAKLRNITACKQIGHTGTLDPFATGLLVCALGSATKMVGLFNLLPKIYEAEIRLGVISNTYDRTGKIEIQNSKLNRNSKFEIENLLKSFIGKQQQIPPMYSAKKVNGKKLYDLARQGMEVERQPAEIEIYNIELLSNKIQDTRYKIQTNPKSQITIKVTCSAGTYIRTLAHDIGEKLGCGAVLWELKRTSIGARLDSARQGFNLEQAVSLDQLTSANYQNFLKKPLEVLTAVNQSCWEHF